MTKKQKKQRRWRHVHMHASSEVCSGSSLLADLNFQSASGLYKNFTRISPSESEIVVYFIGESISKRHGVQEIHLRSRNFGTDVKIFGTR
jgi:hypothetical protein